MVHNSTNNDLIGQIRFSGASFHGTDLENPMAYIERRVDGTSDQMMPSRLSFYTTPDNTGSPVERLHHTTSVISMQETLTLVDMHFSIILHSDQDISLDRVLELIVDLPS